MDARTWHADNTITEVELVRQVKLGAVTEMIIEQTQAGFAIIVRLKWHSEPVALRTRRDETDARLFKSLERLVDLIRDRFPAIEQVSLVLSPKPKKVVSKNRNR